ncbi:MAG TPA: hypothetical protein VGM96_07545 [Reyranella sp.]|jgi:hypothetical protein
MSQSLLFLIVAGIPIFLFLRSIRALRLGWGYAVVLTLPITIALWFVVNMIVDLGRI